MIRSTICLLGAVGCLTAAGWFVLGGWKSAAAVAPVEELLVTPAVHDFGTVGQGETLTAEFTVTNNYRQPVRIVELTTHCSCVQPMSAKRELAPGESTTLQVGYRTHGKRGQSSQTLGILHQVGTGFTVQNYGVQAEVLPDLTLVPERLTFGDGQPAERTLTLAVRAPSSGARIATAHCSAEAVTPTVAADGRSVTLKYDPARPVSAGVAHQVLLKLTAAGQMWLEVPVLFESAGHPPRSGP